MPIKFYCPQCDQLLGIAMSHAGRTADCPACGESLLVPGIAGLHNAVPPPIPGEDAADLKVVIASLLELELPNEDSDPPLARAERVERPSFQHAEVFVLPQRDAGYVAEPIVRVSEDSGNEESLSSGQILEGLAREERPSTKQSRNRNSLLKTGVLLLVGMAAGGVLGGMLSSHFSHRVSGVSNPEEHDSPAVVFPHVAEKGDSTVDLRVTGSVTVEQPTGEDRPEAGARVLVLPLKRVGSSKLSATGFRIGADDVDQQILALSVERLGGGFQLTNDAGMYDVQVSRPGKYRLLIGARSQLRPDSQALLSDCREFLADYFEKPEQVLGASDYQIYTLEVGENLEPVRNVRFERN
ncbi:hypothetical protein SH668x_002580 [Planctomicrobium sp. SH668]|uniref:hypothetical protein n=1 Tax=Planctomicrobium sp. SH668 TaxID=3448126 RepID=UPI003F5CB86D